MELHTLSKVIPKTRIRLGRGNGSKGTFCGRGCKGQGQRKSGNVRPGFEGGQTPLYKRLPKLKGFKNNRKEIAQVVNVGQLEQFKSGEKITDTLLFEKGLIRNQTKAIKILGRGELSKKLNIDDSIEVSKSARVKIEKAAG